MTLYKNAQGQIVPRLEARLAQKHGVDPSQLTFRECTICTTRCNCFNGWCGVCLQDFHRIHGKWPCQVPKEQHENSTPR